MTEWAKMMLHAKKREKTPICLHLKLTVDSAFLIIHRQKYKKLFLFQNQMNRMFL